MVDVHIDKIVSRWVLTERKARWLVRTIPDRPGQHVIYRPAPIGYVVRVEEWIYELGL